MSRKRTEFSLGWAGAILALLLIGCATNPKPQYGEVEKIVQDRTGHAASWEATGSTDADIKKAIAPLLNQPLTVSSAVQIALVNNRSLRGTLKEIGISQAELVQAGLLANPELGILPRWPTSGNGGNNTELDLMQDFLDAIALPLRKRVAAGRLEQMKARVAHEALDLVYQVQVAFYTLQGQIQACDRQRTIQNAMDAAMDLAQRQRQAGNISDLTIAGQEITFETTKLDLANMELQIQTNRERLNRLMGLWGPESAAWTIGGELPSPPDAEFSIEHLEKQAVERRMDLAAARDEVSVLEQTLALQRATRWTSLFQFGVDYERDVNGTKVVGPHLILGLPIFDRGQGRLAQTQARLAQSLARMTSLATNIRSEVREARERMIAARNTAVFYRDTLLPKHEHLVALSQTYYNGMQLGIFVLLRARQNEAEAQRDYISALRDYWIARARLATAMGGGILSESSGQGETK